MTRLVVDGVGLHVEQAGVGTPLLLLHGFTGTTATWSEQRPSWQRSFRTIAVDLTGHGRSDAPDATASYEFDRQVDGISAVLDELGTTPCHIVGYSMGARIALSLAIRYPMSVARLALESPSAGLADRVARTERREADAALADRIERDGVAAFVNEWEGRPLFTTQSTMPATARERVRAERLSQRAAGLAGALRGAGPGAMEPMQTSLDRVRSATLVVAGALDSTGLERAEEVAAGIPDAQLEVIDDAGHAPHLEQPERFGRLVNAFLAPSPATASR